jgi:hypothetical protein
MVACVRVTPLIIAVYTAQYLPPQLLFACVMAVQRMARRAVVDDVSAKGKV